MLAIMYISVFICTHISIYTRTYIGTYNKTVRRMHLSSCGCQIGTEVRRNVIMTPLLRQNDVQTSFGRNHGVIITLRVNREKVITLFRGSSRPLICEPVWEVQHDSSNRYTVLLYFVLSGLYPLKRKCHFDEIFNIGCTGSCHRDNFRC